MMMAFWLCGRFQARWWTMRPASHMPLAEIMMAPPLMRFSALDSSTSATNLRSIPWGCSLNQVNRLLASSSKSSKYFSVKWVAAVAIGESIQIFKWGNFFCFTNLIRINRISWVRPTAKAGIKILPPCFMVSLMTFTSSSSVASMLLCKRSP